MLVKSVARRPARIPAPPIIARWNDFRFSPRPLGLVSIARHVDSGDTAPLK
jgi:hypothetical protein